MPDPSDFKVQTSVTRVPLNYVTRHFGNLIRRIYLSIRKRFTIKIELQKIPRSVRATSHEGYPRSSEEEADYKGEITPYR